MKKTLILVVSLITFSTIKGQDLIVLKDANEISVKVQTITPKSVYYKRWSNIEGPTYEIPKSNIFFIKYQNGEKDIMNTNLSPTEDSKKKSFIQFAGYVNGGAVFDEIGAGATFDFTLGVNLYDYVYAGVELGFYSIFEKYPITHNDGFIEEKTVFGGYIPMGINIKAYILKDKPAIPFFNCTIGGFWGVAGVLKSISGFHCQVGFGIDINGCSINIGYSPLVVTSAFDIDLPIHLAAHCGYVKLGVPF